MRFRLAAVSTGWSSECRSSSVVCSNWVSFDCRLINAENCLSWFAFISGDLSIIVWCRNLQICKFKMKANPIVYAIAQICLSDWIMALSMIFGGCCSNVYTLEILVKSANKSGILITFGQIIVVALEGLLSNINFSNGWFRLKERIVPIKTWCFMVTLFLTVSMLNNYALGFNIAMPLHIIFRSGSLLVSMLVGYLVFGQK